MAHNPTVPEIPALRGSRGPFYGWFAVVAAFAVTFVDFGWRRTKSTLSPILCFIQHWKRYERAVQELSRLSDRELADIGITRGDIHRIAKGQSRRQAVSGVVEL
jgi:uncharacterized protein YjiS (DUF1127 family)